MRIWEHGLPLERAGLRKGVCAPCVLTHIHTQKDESAFGNRACTERLENGLWSIAEFFTLIVISKFGRWCGLLWFRQLSSKVQAGPYTQFRLWVERWGRSQHEETAKKPWWKPQRSENTACPGIRWMEEPGSIMCKRDESGEVSPECSEGRCRE